MVKNVGNAGITARMKVLEAHFKKSPNALGLAAGLGNATVDDWNDNQLGNPTRTCKEFLKHYGISLDWWKTGKGDVFNTYDQNEAAIARKTLGVTDAIRTVVEQGTEYYVIPKIIFQQKYMLVAQDQFDKEQTKWDQDKETLRFVLGLLEKQLSEKEQLQAKAQSPE